MTFRTCAHCGREYEDVFNRIVCSDKCSLEILVFLPRISILNR